MTFSTWTKGAQWAPQSIRPLDESLDAEAIMAAIVGRFEELCAEHGDPTVQWILRTSGVHWETDRQGHSTHDLTRDHDDLREQAIREVWDRIETGEYSNGEAL